MLYLTPVAWIIFLILEILSPMWATLCIVNICLLSANVIGYYKCNKDHQGKLKGFVQDKMQGAMQAAVMNKLMGGGNNN